MNIFKKKKKTEDENRIRIQKLVTETLDCDTPNGWTKKTFAVGGLTEVGFSKLYPELLLIISSQGRGLFDCSKLELIERDKDSSYDWFNTYELYSMGIGKTKSEKIKVGGLSGGGLSYQNKYGESIEYLATEWPIIDLIFEPKNKYIYQNCDSVNCYRIFHDYELRAYGFSYDGEYFVVASSSYVNIYRREKITIN
jgi:hypothetical protein